MADRSTTSIFESLEQRRLMAVSLSEGELLITGTKLNNNIRLTVEGTTPDQLTVRIDGFVRRFLLADVEKINIQAGQGNDLIAIDEGKSRLNQPTRLYGSGGDDTIQAGNGTDRIYGGDGADHITGGNRRDVIYGEGGADSINGGNGSDIIDGNEDNDTLIGGRGTDYLYGSAGNDSLFADDGASDAVNGGLDVDGARTDLIDGLTSIENAI